MISDKGGNMKTGDFFMARTHAEFLNKAFGTDYKSWMKAAWNYNEYYLVWMVKFDGIVRQDWRNVILNDDEILEENVGAENNDKNSYLFYRDKFRIAISVQGDSGYRKYVFKGVYRFNKEKSILHHKHYYFKVSDEFKTN